MSAAHDIHVGTSGFFFRGWVGPFYPAGMPSSDFLEYYARQFPVVEVNSTYYGIPKPRVLANMARRTPQGFRFVVKLHKSMTHEPKLDLAKVREFLDAIAPLKLAGKYDGLLAQFPWGFRRDTASKAHLEALRESFPDEPISVGVTSSSGIQTTKEIPAAVETPCRGVDALLDSGVRHFFDQDADLHGLLTPPIRVD